MAQGGILQSLQGIVPGGGSQGQDLSKTNPGFAGIPNIRGRRHPRQMKIQELIGALLRGAFQKQGGNVPASLRRTGPFAPSAGRALDSYLGGMYDRRNRR